MRKAGDVISALFQDRFGPDFMESARSSAGLFSSWEKIISEIWPDSTDPGDRDSPQTQNNDDVPAAAVHSRICELEKGVLLVEADHPGWIQILRTKQRELLSHIQRRYPELNIRAIAFRLSRTARPVAAAPEPEAATPEAAAPEPNTVTPEVTASGAKTRDSPDETPALSPQAESMTKDEDFYIALKKLEESITKRNK